MTRFLLLLGVMLSLAGCDRGDWRAAVAASAEDVIRQQVHDPEARFTHVQVTGDDSTGQTCGRVTANAGAATGRFILYIDGTAGPFVEHNVDGQGLDDKFFDRAWQSDCVKEGYSL